MFGILGTLQQVDKCQGPERQGCCWLRFVKWSRVKNNKKKLNILTVKIKLAPRNLKLLLSRKQSNDNAAPFPLYPIFSPIGCQGVERVKEKGWIRVEERRTHKVAKVNNKPSSKKIPQRLAKGKFVSSIFLFEFFFSQGTLACVMQTKKPNQHKN